MSWFLIIIGLVVFGVILSKIFNHSKEDNVEKKGQASPASIENTELQYYICIPQEIFKTNEFGEIVRNSESERFGPFSLSELKKDYGEYLTEDTMITTDTLNGEYYEARCFECFDELFSSQWNFKINEFGEIIRI